MSRPKCCRQVSAIPFQPEGVTSSSCPEEVFRNLDEYESLRLADSEGLYQEQTASRMNVSRQTFGRIVEAARRCRLAHYSDLIFADSFDVLQ
ncbi:MAG: hypothetical protein C0394_09490 [Syntrophus sp. (in: bacteria)]|nr:hypothetical protein [Syntrophus sp. (in: bacteria)]